MKNKTKKIFVVVIGIIVTIVIGATIPFLMQPNGKDTYKTIEKDNVVGASVTVMKE